MDKTEDMKDGERHASDGTLDIQPLIATLVSMASRRGHKMGDLARELGVTYERLGQWRRRPAEISSAGTDVYDRAAKYLGIPTALVMVMGGKIRLSHFVWPATAPVADRVARELKRLRQDASLGGFVPDGLSNAAPDVQLFVLFLYAQISGQGAKDGMGLPWLSALHQAVTGEQMLRAAPGWASHPNSGGDRVF
ncbi:hypothetical protein [Rhodoferax fermentans]|uniref:Uncharacterized protein n=1 Tax=Rhodoferax fermentans TaxID=28066 RepID=A0A1T1ANK3_RHOFE|nr:hypothetical protein [Rhodoferax fermentans]MBK1683117.1 hypothetical protein [Rhodoferax fermentans]OOV05726.1 hypothetical protein RF819_02530 [Rhodoferax fermentans]